MSGSPLADVDEPAWAAGMGVLIDVGTPPERLFDTGLRWLSGARFVVGWKGHLFVPGKTAGRESVDHLVRRLDGGADLGTLMGEFNGVFGLFVHDRSRAVWQIAIDNAGLYKVYWDERGCSTSLLELTRARGIRPDQLRSEALIEFLAHGTVFGSGTFVDGVRELRWDELLELPATGGRPRLLSKQLDEPGLQDAQSVVEHFEPLAHSLAGLEVSADITGGFDTRLINCLLHQAGADFELAISGRADAADVRIAREIARLLDRPFHVTPHDLSRLEEDLPLVFRDGDGQMDCCHFHRMRQHCLARLARGVQVMTHGAGGAHFKDFFSFQDFPRYGSPVVNFERLYDLRMAAVAIPHRYLSEHGATLLARVRPRALARFAEFKAPTNSESYDRVIYFLRANEIFGRTYTSYIDLGLDVVAPLLDWRNAHVAMKLSPWDRFLNRWHRRVLTAHCPRLAGLRTTEGCSASTELRYLLPDIAGYTSMQSRRLIKKTSERLLGKALLAAPTVGEPSLWAAVRRSGAFRLALDRLKDADLFAPALEPADVRDPHLGRVLNIGLFLHHVEQSG